MITLLQNYDFSFNIGSHNTFNIIEQMFSLAWYWISILLCLMFFILYITLRFLKNKIINAQVKKELELKKKILSHIHLAWCLWDRNQPTVECSKEFKDLLELNDLSFVTIEEIFKRLNAGSFSPLAKAMQHILDYGGFFQLQLTLNDIKKEIQISGEVLDFSAHEKETDSNNNIFLSIHDITKNAEITLLTEEKIKTLDQENKILTFLSNESPLALWHRNRKGTIDYCNTAYAGAINASISRVVAENLSLLKSAQANLYDLSRQALLHSEKMVLRAHTVINGERRFLEIAEIPMHDTGTTVGYAMDITEIEDIEEKLYQTEKSYKDILNALSVPIAVYNELRRLSFYNLAYQQLFDFDPHFLEKSPTLGDILDDLRNRRKIQEYANFKLHKDDRNLLFTNLLESTEEISHMPDGRTLRIRISPYPLGGILFIFENITNQLGLERDVNTLMAVQQATLDHLNEGIVVIGNDGKIKLSNPAAYEIWAINLDDHESEFHFRYWLDIVKSKFVDKNQHQSWQDQLSKRLSDRKSHHERLYLNNNQVIEWFYVPLPDSSHMLGFSDVSDEWFHEQALKARNLNLELSQSLKNDYIQEVSTELHPPIDDILGFSDTLRQEVFGPLNEKQLDYCHMIHHHAQDLKILLTDVLESIQIDHDHMMITPKIVNIEKLIINFEQFSLKKGNDHGIDIHINKNINSPTIYADEKRLLKSFLGILGYFIRNTPKGKEITMDIKTENQFLILTLKNEFLKGQKNINSLNLGKAMAKIIIERHYGKIIEEQDSAYQWICCRIPIDHRIEIK